MVWIVIKNWINWNCHCCF